MTSFDQKFIENPQFLKWVFYSNTSTDQYWTQYLLEHPDEKGQLLELKNHLSELNFSNDTLLHSEKEELAGRVVSKINRDLKQYRRRLFIASFMKYAAVAILFAAIGGLVVYLYTSRESVYEQLAGQMIQIPSTSQGPVLITSNGENVELRKSNSSVDYSSNGTVVLNSDSVIQAEPDVPNVMNQLVIPYGNQSRVVLSDNTVVWLNAGSRLVYPTLFNEKNREVMLFGEAVFEVSKNPEKPFIVRTSDLSIKVLGTTFNITAYAEDQVIQTVLKEGSVAIRRNNAGFYEKDLILKPNQMASFNKSSNESNVYEVDANGYLIWTQGLISFDEMDFNQISKKLERFYNISIRFSDPDLASIRMVGKLDMKRGKEEVLEYLQKVSLTRIEKVSDNQYVVKE